MKESNEFQDLILKGTQYIIAPSVDEFPFDYDPWANYHEWNVDTACQAITLSRIIDMEKCREIAKSDIQKEEKDDKKNKDSECPIMARHICRVYDRAKLLAENAVRIGTINESDSPANWIKWADENRYNVQHLKFILDPEAMEAFRKRIDEDEVIDFPEPLVENTAAIITLDENINHKDKDKDKNIENDCKFASFFDPVPLNVIKNMFPHERWETWASHASQNNLVNAREARGKYNPYKAAMWFLDKGVSGWDLSRCYRVLAKNLPTRSLDDKHLFTGDYE